MDFENCIQLICCSFWFWLHMMDFNQSANLFSQSPVGLTDQTGRSSLNFKTVIHEHSHTLQPTGCMKDTPLLVSVLNGQSFVEAFAWAQLPLLLALLSPSLSFQCQLLASLPLMYKCIKQFHKANGNHINFACTKQNLMNTFKSVLMQTPMMPV